MTQAAPVTGQRIQGLDLLRGVAIVLVLLRHSWPERFGTAGVVGVVTFFALSGYLITGLLVRDVATSGRVRYGRFYLHRAVRLLPALYLLLAVHAVVALTVDPLREGPRGALWGVFAGVTYTANLPGVPPSDAVLHLWTLATEEQFYLVWPLLLAFGLRRGRGRLVVWLAAAVVVAGLLVSMVRFREHLEAIFVLPFSWSIALVLGAAARLGADRIAAVLPSSTRARNALATAALAGLVVIGMLPEAKDAAVQYLVGGPVVALCALVLVFRLRDVVVAPAALRPLLALGVVSYGLYLWSYPITRWVEGRDHRLSPVEGLLVVVATLAAAAVSWFLVERPAQRWRRRWDSRASRQENLAPQVD